MPSTKPSEPVLQPTISLAEVNALRNEATKLNSENAELKSENEHLKRQISDLTEPKKKADAAAFRRSRGI